jgi:hypothetical protein
LQLAKSLDPNLAADLERSDSDLDTIVKNQSTAELTNWSNASLATLHGDSGPVQFQEFKQLIGEQHTLRDVELKSNTDADDALSLSKSIKSAPLRVQALAAIAKSLVKSDPHRAASLLDEAESAMKTISDDDQRVEVIVPVASIWGQLGNKKRALSLLSAGYSMAEALLKKEGEDHEATDEVILLGPAASALVRLAQAEATVDFPNAVARANSFSGTPAVQGLLLIEVARIILSAEPHAVK